MSGGLWKGILHSCQLALLQWPEWSCIFLHQESDPGSYLTVCSFSTCTTETNKDVLTCWASQKSQAKLDQQWAWSISIFIWVMYFCKVFHWPYLHGLCLAWNMWQHCYLATKALTVMFRATLIWCYVQIFFAFVLKISVGPCRHEELLPLHSLKNQQDLINLRGLCKSICLQASYPSCFREENFQWIGSNFSNSVSCNWLSDDL